MGLLVLVSPLFFNQLFNHKNSITHGTQFGNQRW